MNHLEKLAKLVRYWSLFASTQAGSGHPTSSLSATDLMVTLLFGGYFRFDTVNVQNPNNDRVIFSKGHASPLFYALWAAAGEISEKDLETYRRFGSALEGHPTPAFRFTEAATGSLGQGLSVGLGMALSAKYVDKTDARIFVLLGDSEMTEGSVWEAAALAAHYKLNNLVGIIDVNRLGQRGETMYGHDVEIYRKRLETFGWRVVVVDGHNFGAITSAYGEALKAEEQPTMIVAKTFKGKGISFLENKEGWHGKSLSKEDFEKAKEELGEIDFSVRGNFETPAPSISKEMILNTGTAPSKMVYQKGERIATRQAYGDALVTTFAEFPEMVVLDAEVSNSTFVEVFKKHVPERFFEMFIAEQNMVGAAIGLARRGKIPFVSTFAAFFSRTFDQVRMAQYSQANVKFMGSHAGVSIGEDGASQMGLEDIALFRSVLESVVLYPFDAVAARKLVREAAAHPGIVYVRMSRPATPVVYDVDEEFPIGGSKTLRSSERDTVTLVSAGITLWEALKAADELEKKGIVVRVIDLYSVKPLDTRTLLKASRETRAILTIEDHYPAGGIGEAVGIALAQESVPVYSLAVRKVPHSGKAQELLDFEEISSRAIQEKVEEILKK
jgi:transketolase